MNKKNFENFIEKDSILNSLTDEPDRNLNLKEFHFYNYKPNINNENFNIEKNDYFDIIKNTEKEVNKDIKKNIKYFLNLEKNPLNIIPQVNNLDLKRNISDRLNYLNSKTEEAIYEILNSNLKEK